jgi:hypothetical protein
MKAAICDRQGPSPRHGEVGLPSRLGQGQQARSDQRESGDGSDEPAVQRGCAGWPVPYPGYRVLRVEARARSEAEAAVLHPTEGRRAVCLRGTVDAGATSLAKLTRNFVVDLRRG